MEQGLQVLTALVETSRRSGARGTELLLEESTGFHAEVLRGRVLDHTDLDEHRLRVCCWLEGGRAGVVTGRLDDGAALVDQALEVAAEAVDDPLSGPVDRLPPAPRGLGIDDRRYALLTEGSRLDVVLTAERIARAVDRRVETGPFTYRDQRRFRAFANSKGVAKEEWSTSYRVDGELTVHSDSQLIEMTDSIASRSFASIASLPYGGNLAKRAIALCRPGTEPTGPIRVMLPPRVVAPLFGRVATGFTSEALHSGAVFLSRGLDGEALVDRRLHLLDDGSLPGGLRTHSFDDHGVPPVPLTLLREGHVEAQLLDPPAARRHQIHPTGHVHGGHLQPTNLTLRSGTRSMHALLSEHGGTVLMVDHIDGLDGLDLKTGALSCRAWGFLMQGQQRVGAVHGVPLRADLVDLLRGLVDLASDTDRIGHVDAPGMLLDGFVAG